MLIAPRVPLTAETLEMNTLVDTYGKTWHTWQVDRNDKLPYGTRWPPFLFDTGLLCHVIGFLTRIPGFVSVLTFMHIHVRTTVT